MAKNTIFTVKYRRKREGKTNYKKRLSLLKSGMPRLIIRRTNTEMIIQIANYEPDGDKVVVSFSSNHLAKHGWNYSKKSIPACYLAGLILGKLAIEKNVEEAILDLGLQTPVKGSKVYSVLKGVYDAGVKIPVDESVFPSEDRISGKHIVDTKDVEGFQFSSYKKNKLDISNISKVFEEVKSKILKNK
jgi:large subunit ribosomal protein L18